LLLLLLLLQELARALPADRTVERELVELAAADMARHGSSAILHWAVMNCRCVALVRALLNTGADTEALSSSGQTALHAGAATGGECYVQQLLAAGASTAAVERRTGRTALHYAAMSGEEGCLKRLLAAGASVSAVDQHGLTALAWAADRCHPAIVRALLEAGSELEATGKICPLCRKWRERCLPAGATAGRGQHGSSERAGRHCAALGSKSRTGRLRPRFACSWIHH
jgi:hypothetical protein